MTNPRLEICIICDTIVTDSQLHDGQHYCTACDPFNDCPSCHESTKDADPSTLLCPGCLAKAKECCHCKKLKPLSDYYKQKTSSDGHRPSCKACVSEAQARSRLATGKAVRTHNALADMLAQLKSLKDIVEAQQIELAEVKLILSSAGLT